ncbi:PTS fructose transporter subunit IIA [Niveibacterium sp. SC-1]|uniref:PTS sugar transporter subunit IIA n=1 Tax=Niveibacterium sp. SC-1 TaxID=3135646 RepID=UPI00311F417E
MIGLFLVTHGTLGESLIQCACHVLNRRPQQLAQLGVSAADDPLDVLPTARALLATVDSGEGVIVMTDIFGATPSNIALKLLRPGVVEGISGANLPMLLRILTYRERNDIQTVVTRAIAGGCDGVMHMKVDRDAKN